MTYSGQRPLNIGITCYPSVGGSGVLATALGEHLAQKNHTIHFIAYERPFRLPEDSHIQFHPVQISGYSLFPYPDYTLPLSVKMAEVARDHHLDILHVHYAVPHATAAILARDMLPQNLRPKIITTLHGTDTTLLGQDPAYRPAIQHALAASDAITTVSHFLKQETQRLLQIENPIDVIHNFYQPRPAPNPPRRPREEVRAELNVAPNETLLLHISNLRPIKRIDLLLQTLATLHSRLKTQDSGLSFKLLILAGEPFAPFEPEVRRLNLQNHLIIREKVADIEDYLNAADIGLYTSESESFCLSILESMCFACPSVAFNVGGIPEVIEHEKSGLLIPFGDVPAAAAALASLIADPQKRQSLGQVAQRRAAQNFSAAAIVQQYELLYHRTLR